jgi:predicted HicB family RNase H-like nuclease
MTRPKEPRIRRMMVRIPTSLRDNVERVATDHERTMNDWIVVTLQAAIAQRNKRR